VGCGDESRTEEFLTTRSAGARRWRKETVCPAGETMAGAHWATEEQITRMNTGFKPHSSAFIRIVSVMVKILLSHLVRRPHEFNRGFF